MTKGFSNLNRFVTTLTLTSTINFLFRFVTTLISTINFMTMDFDYLNYVTSTKLKKVNDKNVKPVSHLILKISFLTLFGCAVKITLDINILTQYMDSVRT